MFNNSIFPFNFHIHLRTIATDKIGAYDVFTQPRIIPDSPRTTLDNPRSDLHLIFSLIISLLGLDKFVIRPVDITVDYQYFFYSTSTSAFITQLDRHGLEMKSSGKIAKKVVIPDLETKKKRVNARHIGSTPGFTAPELLVPDDALFFSCRNSFALDVYSAGMTILCFLIKRPTFLNLDFRNATRWDESDAIKKQVKKERIFTMIAECWSVNEMHELNSLVDLVFQCIDFNHRTRISSSRALQTLLVLPK